MHALIITIKTNIRAASQYVLAEFSHLLSMYIVFSGRASFNWAVDCPGLVLFLTVPAHEDNGTQRPAGIYWPLARQR